MTTLNEFENYAITEIGEIYSLKRIAGRSGKGISTKCNKMKLSSDNNGYQILSLTKNKKRYTRSLHRLVAITFIPNPENKRTINHIDGNKKNNNVSNLEWATYKENSDHAWENNLKKPQHGETNGMAKLTNDSAKNLIQDLINGITNPEAAIKYNLHSRYISLIRHKKRWKKLWNTEFLNEVSK